jgi:imidazolonepropionase-like amidohydrolase
MANLAVVAGSYFNGERHFSRGPYTLAVNDRIITDIAQGDCSEALARCGAQVARTAFVMPGLVDSHCHLFLDGSLLDIAARARHLDLPLRSLAQTARLNARAAASSGITLLRDAGDRYGINHILRAEAADPASGLPAIRSAGIGVKRAGRYGTFMAMDVGDKTEIIAAVLRIAAESDDVKVVLTGTVDFAIGGVTSDPQFNLEEAMLIARTARNAGKKTFAHCSGEKGMSIALAANFDSIEHGFLANPAMLPMMADKGIAWTPTFSPVHFQWTQPQVSGWSAEAVSNLGRILDQHAEHLRIAEQAGVTLLLGTDAGSPGVSHGASVIDEIQRFVDAGLRMESALRAATSAPRRHWGMTSSLLAKGMEFDAVLLNGSPFDSPGFLHNVAAVFRAGVAIRGETIGVMS